MARLPGGWTSSSSSEPSAVPRSRRPSVAESSPSATASGASGGTAHAEAILRVRDPRADVRVQRPHGALELGSGAAGVELALIPLDLLRVGHAFLPLGLGLGPLVECLDQQPAAQVGQPGGQAAVVVTGVDRLGGAQVDRPGVQLRHRAHDADAGLGVARLDGPLHRRRAAPARQQRRVHVVGLVGRQQRLADDGPVGAHQQRVRPGGGDPLDRGVGVQIVGLGHVDAQLARSLGHRRRLGAPAPPARAVGAREHELRPVGRSGHSFEDRCAEIGGSKEDGAHISHPRGEPKSPVARTHPG